MGTTGRRRRGTGPGEGKRARILEFVQEFGQREGYAPSLREIGAELGLSASTVSYHLAAGRPTVSCAAAQGSPALSPALPALDPRPAMTRWWCR
jgi:SOS-response transcriptional repressor LexA